MHIAKRTSFVLVLLFSTSFTSVYGMGDQDNAIRTILESQYSDTTPYVSGEKLHTIANLQRFYDHRGYTPAWFEAGDMTSLAHDLFHIIENVHQDALIRDDYHYQALKDVFSHGDGEHSMTPVKVGDVDLLLTDAFLLLGSHYLSGKVNPETLGSEWLAMPRGGDMVDILEKALVAKDIQGAMEKLLPNQLGYAQMKEALTRYQDMAKNGGWSNVSLGKVLKVGDSDERVIELRKRLSADHPELMGDAVADLQKFDEALEKAVILFQKRHGLEQDGVVGPKSIKAMNVSVEDRLAQIEINLERWRWLPGDLGDRFILVNIANFDLKVIEDNKIIQKHKVIVGKDYRRTPIFSDKISYLVLNPTWTVPRSIATKDKLKLIKRDPSYLTRKNFSVYEGWGANQVALDPLEIDWSKVTRRNFRYRLVQGPGEGNALGQVKFMFPNKFSVYLHDTPSRELFNETSRAFSSGCIRVHDPLRLAELLLSNKDDWTRDKIDNVVASGNLKTVRLKKKVPVHLLYWTSWVDDDGTLAFRDDIYNRDKAILESMHFKAPSI